MRRFLVILAVGLFSRAFGAVDTLDLADNSRGYWFSGGKTYDTNKGDLWATPCTVHVKNTLPSQYVNTYWPYGITVVFINNTNYNLTIEYGFTPGIGRITFPGYQYRMFVFADNVLNAASTN